MLTKDITIKFNNLLNFFFKMVLLDCFFQAWTSWHVGIASTPVKSWVLHPQMTTFSSIWHQYLADVLRISGLTYVIKKSGIVRRILLSDIQGMVVIVPDLNQCSQILSSQSTSFCLIRSCPVYKIVSVNRFSLCRKLCLTKSQANMWVGGIFCMNRTPPHCWLCHMNASK